MKTRLIVLIDFSPYSDALLHLAGSWCKLLKAHLVLAHKVKGYLPAFAEEEEREKIFKKEKEEALGKLRTLAQENTAVPDTIQYEVFKEDFLTFLPELLKKGKEQGFHDLLFLGLKGTGFLKKIVSGSTATTLIDHLNFPMVAVPIKINQLLPKRFIVALHDRFPLNQAAFDQVLRSFKNNVQQLEFISVDTSGESEDYLYQLREHYTNTIPSSYQLFQDTDADVFEKIKAYVHQQTDSLLVVQKGSRSLSDQVFRKFLINELVHDGSMPLLIIPQ